MFLYFKKVRWYLQHNVHQKRFEGMSAERTCSDYEGSRDFRGRNIMNCEDDPQEVLTRCPQPQAPAPNLPFHVELQAQPQFYMLLFH